jgi:DNA-binding protein H-NS
MSSAPLDELVLAAGELGYRDLKSLHREIEQLLHDKRQEAEVELARRQAELAAELGLDAKPKRGRAKIRYRDPDDPENTWTGRGEQPEWVTAKLDAGITLADLEIAR